MHRAGAALRAPHLPPRALAAVAAATHRIRGPPPPRARDDAGDDGFFDDDPLSSITAAVADTNADVVTVASAADTPPAPVRRRRAKKKQAKRAEPASAGDDDITTSISMSASADVEEAAAAAPVEEALPPAPVRTRATAAAPPPPPSKSAAPYSAADAADLDAMLDTWSAEDAHLHPQPRALQRWVDMAPRERVAALIRDVRRRLDVEAVVPPLGGAHISYARLLELLATKNVSKVTVLAGGRAAIVETPVEGYSVDYSTAAYDTIEKGILRGQPLPAWSLETTRFWCDLPGDVWEQGTFMRLIKDNGAPVVGPDSTVSAKDTPMVDTAPITELVVAPPSDAFAFLASLKGAAMPIAALLALRAATGIVGGIRRLLGAAPRDADVDALLGELGRSPAIQFNVPGATVGGRIGADTGVRYADVAGVDHVLDRVKEIVAQLLGVDERYRAIGAEPPRGIIFAGPPGTGKTLLARAIAGEAGVPFYAATGSDFVEMYAGVAAARIRDLFKLARKTAPSIIFIDEIDAIARSRALNESQDPGSVEREQGLLQLLVEMDGFSRDDRVLVIGATNLISMLDPAALRPGRFTYAISMDPPRAENRLKILQVHAAGKPVDRSGGGGRDADALLWRVARKTGGWSGAELANLMNEAAILMVRHDKDEIDWPILAEAIDKRDMLAPPSGIPAGEAARRLRLVTAARAVGACLSPSFPRVDAVAVDGRGPMAARVKFDAVDYRQDGDSVIAAAFGGGAPDRWRPRGGQAPWAPVPATAWEVACTALAPLLMPRAAELLFFGADGVTLATAREVAAAGDYAHWLAVASDMSPTTRATPTARFIPTDAGDDTLTKDTASDHAAAGVRLQAAAWERALTAVRGWRSAIEAVAAALDASPDAEVDGDTLTRLLDAHPPPGPGGRMPLAGWSGDAAFCVSAGRGKPGAARFGVPRPPPALDAWAGAGVDLADADAVAAVTAVVGALGGSDLTASGLPADARTRVLVALADPTAAARLAAQRRYAATDDAPFPPPPSVDVNGPALVEWAPALGGPPYSKGGPFARAE